MLLPEIYEKNIADYLEESKFKQLPLLSWDLHMQNLSLITKFQEDVHYLEKLVSTYKTNADILKEYKENKAVIVITDINLTIEYASNNLIEMSGYQPNEVVGNTPKMFQGPKTDQLISGSIRKLVNQQEEFDYILENYKKDQTTYHCHIKGFPVFDKKGIATKYVAIEKVA